MMQFGNYTDTLNAQVGDFKKKIAAEQPHLRLQNEVCKMSFETRQYDFKPTIQLTLDPVPQTPFSQKTYIDKGQKGESTFEYLVSYLLQDLSSCLGTGT